jgi:uncharacterized protein DUF4012
MSALGGTAPDLERAAQVTADMRDEAPMLGAQSPRRYLVVFQNTAEARGTGGLPGAFAALTIHQGQLRFETFGTDTMLAGRAEPPHPQRARRTE